ncbi:MAG: preprotein translocase subunit YajC [Rickettsiaceae bacterium]|nr:preprotein translocase subunit YajC [Rickettsiaceae bacterium]
MDTTDTITVQDTSSAAAAPPPVESNGWTSLVPMVLIFVVFYFLLIRPQEKKRRNQETLVSGVKKGEEVMTNSGLFGVISKINDSDNTVMLQIAKDVEIKVLKTSIADIVSRSKKPEDTKDKKQIDAKSGSSVKQKKK